jgi:hypothetical protein
MLRRIALSLLATLAAGCLPADTRPPPAAVEMTASAGPGTRGITDTVDGYQIGFEFVRASIGQPYVGDQSGDDGGPCSEYYSPQYSRLFDFVAVEQPEKVGLGYALGPCSFSYFLRFPNYDAIIGTGATAEDGDYMRTPPDGDESMDMDMDMDTGISLWVSGLATKGDIVKSFKWEFRAYMGLRECWIPDGDTKQTTFTLASDEKLTLNVEMQAEALFRDQLDAASGLLRFQPFADADTNDDGAVSMEELDAVKLSDLYPGYVYPAIDPKVAIEDRNYYCADTDGNEIAVISLADYLYCAAAPSVARFNGDGGCKISVGRRRRRD